MSDFSTPAVMTIKDFGVWASIGQTRIYAEINSRALQTFKLGKRAYIRTVDAQAGLGRCVAGSANANA